MQSHILAFHVVVIPDKQNKWQNSHCKGISEIPREQKVYKNSRYYPPILLPKERHSMIYNKAENVKQVGEYN